MISVQNLPFVGEWYRYCSIGIRSASATWMDVNSNCTSRFHWGSSWPAQLPHCQLITEDTHDKCRSTWLITQCMLYLVSYAHPMHISSSNSILIMLAIITMLHHFFFFAITLHIIHSFKTSNEEIVAKGSWSTCGDWPVSEQGGLSVRPTTHSWDVLLMTSITVDTYHKIHQVNVQALDTRLRTLGL